MKNFDTLSDKDYEEFADAIIDSMDYDAVISTLTQFLIKDLQRLDETNLLDCLEPYDIK